MSDDRERVFPRWEELYEQQAVESMPWFNPDLDQDLEEALDKLGLRGGSILDIGTGPGTQAIQLARRGFDVTATDISATAIRLAETKAQEQGVNVVWKKDDILHTGLEQQLDLIFDRGCFHVIPPDQRQDYVHAVAGLLKRDGYLFLKCFSHLQPGTLGPYRFTSQQIHELFGTHFLIESVKETVYQGTLNPLPRALFTILRPRDAGASARL